MDHRTREDANVDVDADVDADVDVDVDVALAAALVECGPPRLRSALVHAVFPGGGRVRPRFCLAVARAAREEPRPASSVAVAAGTAVELVHCASLVHDDLPCFDDADLRRGRPTVHRAFGEATAVLVGDALIVAAFDVLAAAGAPASAIVKLARATGARGGLVSGQALELEEDGGVDILAYHGAKTAALFEASAWLGATASGVAPEPFAALGRALGLFYQLADDAADAFGDPDDIGKPVGRDEVNERPSAFKGRTRDAARRILESEASHLLAAVPECRGRDELQAFVIAVADRLIARSGVDRLETAERAPARVAE